MGKRTKQAVAIGALATALAVGAGLALAGGKLGFDNDRQAFLSDVAKRLDVTPAALEAALNGAYDDRLDAAVAAGTITKEQAEAMKQRFKEGAHSPFGGFGNHGFGLHGGFGHHGPSSLAAAASYLHLTEAELQTELMSGKTLAQVAKAKDKSVDDLKTALAADSKKKLDAAVKAGYLTQAQADEWQTRLTEHLDDVVNGTGGHPHRHAGPGFGWDGQPPADFGPSASSVPVPAGSTA